MSNLTPSPGNTSAETPTSPTEPPPRGKAPSAALLSLGNFVFRYRDYLAPLAIVLVVLLTSPRPAWGDARHDVWLDVIGLAVAACGQALRVLVIGLAYIQRGGKNKRIAGDRLVTDGIFAHCRHPMYLGNFLLISGLLIIWNAPWAYVGAGTSIALALFAMASAEEAFLQRKFGAEYAAYTARVNRFLPDLRGIRHTMARFAFDWRRVVRKEYTTTFSWTTTALLLMVLERIDWDGLDAGRAVAVPDFLVWLAIVLSWMLARWLKKSGRLVSPD